MEGTEGQNVLRQIQNFVEWHPCRKDLYSFVHDHPMGFFHEKPKEKSDVEDDVETSCFGCSFPIEDHRPTYGCIQCKKFLHKACAELPVEIKHPAHGLHSLTLLHDVTPFVPLDSSKGKFTICCGCEIPIQGMAYGCAACRVFFHKTCLGFPDIMLHQTHPSHRLILNYEYLGGNPPKTFRCQGCTQDHTGFNYSCESCDFTMGIRCILPSSPTTEAGSADKIQAGHLLVLLPEQPADLQEDDCLECGKVIVDSQQKLIFRCKDCRFSLHHDCVLPQIISMLPDVFKYTEHIHELRLRKLPEESQWLIGCYFCDEIIPEIDISIPYYSCTECNFDVHVSCMLFQMDYSLAHRLVSVALNVSPVLVPKPSLTVGDIVKSMGESEKKSLFNIVKAATASTGEKPEDHQQNDSPTNTLIDYPKYSHELFTQTMENFGAKCLDHRSRLRFYAMKSEVEQIGSNTVPKALSPVFKVLHPKYLKDLDTSDANATPNATPMSEGIRIFVFMVLCAAIYSICSTKEKDLDEAQLYTCWECFKIVTEAGFRVDFAFERLKKALNSYFGLQYKSSSDGSLSELDSDMAEISTEMEARLETCTRRVTSLSCHHPEIADKIEIVGNFYIRESWYDFLYLFPISTDDEESPDAIEDASIHREGEQMAKTTKVGADSNNNHHAIISDEIKVYIEKHFLNNRTVLNLSEDEKKKIMDDSFHNHKLSSLRSQTPENNQTSHTPRERKAMNNQTSHTPRERKAICFACDLPISEPTYFCTRCKIHLHDFCVHLPRTLFHPLHGCGHNLDLDQKPGNPQKVKCNACGEICRGIRYRCQRCNFNLEVQCLFREPTKTTKSHGMAVLMDGPTTPNSTQGCFSCRKKIHGPPFLRCAACNVSLHMGCADEKIDNLPLKETWGAKRITSE